MPEQDPQLTPDEVLLQPEDYELPAYITDSYRVYQDKQKQPVKVTRKQIQYFGERGCPWEDIEKFYNVSRVTLMRYYKADYEKGRATTNVALRDKMVQLALAGNATMLIWLGKNRLNMSDLGEVPEGEVARAAETKVTISVVGPDGEPAKEEAGEPKYVQ